MAKVLEYTNGNYSYEDNKNLSYNPSQNTLETFGKCCKDGNDDWYNNIQGKEPYHYNGVEQVIKINSKSGSYEELTLKLKNREPKTISIDANYKDNIPYQYDEKEKVFSMDPCQYIKAYYNSNLHNRLGNFRHTEIQVQALWNKYNDVITPQTLKNSIKELLPVALTDTSSPKLPIDHNIYSLFEACDACEKTQWLQGKKDKFMFAILDNQFTCGNGKYKVKEKNSEKKREKENEKDNTQKVGFASQKELESKELKTLKDKERLGTSNRES